MEEGCYEADAAWCLAVEAWLLHHGFITVLNRRKVLPDFPENRSHNQPAGTYFENKIKVLKRRCYGFHDEQHFFLKILNATGALPSLDQLRDPQF
jgi:hypothetical protein